jgi:hypothetical protein
MVSGICCLSKRPSNASAVIVITKKYLRAFALLSLLLTGSALTANAAIYKKVDADGNVVFTDVPPRPEESAETIEIYSPNSFTAANEGELLAAESEPERTNDAANEYTAVQITSPADDASVRANAGTVTVTAVIEPDLARGHAVQLLMDGAAVAGPSQTATFTLANVDRGTHQLYAQVVDEEGTVLFSGALSTFHMLRYAKRN